MTRRAAGTERRWPVRLLLGGAIIVMVAFWTLLILEDDSIGFGRSWRLLPSGLFIALAITHVVTAPVAWIVSVVVLVSEHRKIAALIGLVAVPVGTLASLAVAMTDAWAWNTAAAQSSGLGSYLVAVAIVTAGPLSLFVLLVAAVRIAR